MARFLAHGGEVHQTAVEAASHSLLREWYVALTVFSIFMYALIRVVYILSGGSRSSMVAAALLAFFVIGLGTYQLSAPVSILSLTAGFGLALLTAMAGLSGQGKRAHKK